MLFLWTLQSTELDVLKNGGDETEEDVAEDEDDENTISLPKQKGFSLIFDVVRRFAQPLGIHLDQWEGHSIETRKGVVRLLSVTDRAKQLFGNEGAEAIANQLERSSEGTVQLALFPESAAGRHLGSEAVDAERMESLGLRKRRLPSSEKRRRWTASTRPCSYRPADGRTRCGRFSKLSRIVAPNLRV
jgi:hypothetical protein